MRTLRTVLEIFSPAGWGLALLLASWLWFGINGLLTGQVAYPLPEPMRNLWIGGIGLVLWSLNRAIARLLTEVLPLSAKERLYCLGGFACLGVIVVLSVAWVAPNHALYWSLGGIAEIGASITLLLVIILLRLHGLLAIVVLADLVMPSAKQLGHILFVYPWAFILLEIAMMGWALRQVWNVTEIRGQV